MKRTGNKEVNFIYKQKWQFSYNNNSNNKAVIY